MNAEDQAAYDGLSKQTGAKFDRAYARDMVADRQKDIAAFKREASNGQNPDIKNFASPTLPTLEDHLKQPMEMEKSVGVQSAKMQ
jgi:putative membrane protein